MVLIKNMEEYLVYGFIQLFCYEPWLPTLFLTAQLDPDDVRTSVYSTHQTIELTPSDPFQKI